MVSREKRAWACAISSAAVSKSAEAVHALRSLEQCADIAALKAVVRPPHDPAVRRAVADVRVRLAEVKALGDAGRLKQAVARISKVVADARETKYEPLVAEALLESAEASSFSGDFAVSERDYEGAIWAAEASRHDEVAVRAAAELVYTVGYGHGRYSDGERWARYASAILRRMGPGHDVVAGWLANNLAAVYEKEGRLPEALSAGFEAVRIKEHALGANHFDVALSYTNVANTLLRLGRIDEAIQKNDQALRILKAALGPDHPRTAFSFAIGAEIMNAKGRRHEAVAMAEQALTTWNREWGPEHPILAYPLTTIGQALIELSQPERALPYLERALKIREVKDPERELLSETRFALARALWNSDRTPGRAIRLARSANVDLRSIQTAVAKERAVAIDDWLAARAERHNPLSLR